MKDSDLLSELKDDATKWAEAFCQTFPDTNIDEGLLQTWFANAIECSYDIRKEKSEREYTIRSWGKWRVVEEWPKVKVKEIIVNSHSTLSYQKHEHRAEFWVVQSGSGTFVKGDRHHLVKPGNTMLVMKGEWHQIVNGNTKPFVIIETQFGEQVTEEDIKRK